MLENIDTNTDIVTTLRNRRNSGSYYIQNHALF